MGRGYLFGIPFPVVVMLLFFGVLYVLLHKMTFGRKTFALGGNEKAAFIAGIKSDRIKIAIYSISGLMAAVAGIIITSRLNSAQPTAGNAYEMDAIASVVLGGTSLSGGRGRLVGTLIGALINRYAEQWFEPVGCIEFLSASRQRGCHHHRCFIGS